MKEEEIYNLRIDAEKMAVHPIPEQRTGEVPFDENPTYGGFINFASNTDGEADDLTRTKQAFDYGFRLGWQTCWQEHNPRTAKPLKPTGR